MTVSPAGRPACRAGRHVCANRAECGRPIVSAGRANGMNYSSARPRPRRSDRTRARPAGGQARPGQAPAWSQISGFTLDLRRPAQSDAAKIGRPRLGPPGDLGRSWGRPARRSARGKKRQEEAAAATQEEQEQEQARQGARLRERREDGLNEVHARPSQDKISPATHIHSAPRRTS